MRLELPAGLAAALAAARACAPEGAFVVGGTLRDAALGRLPTDLDLAVAGDARAYAGRLAAKLGGALVTLDEATRVYRVALGKRPVGPIVQIDVAALQGEDIDADLGRRDFTMNAMALPLSGGGLLDPRGGMRDLKRRRVRADDPKVFPEDPLRLLRAFRLAAQLDLEVEAGTLAAVRKHRNLARRPAGERVRQELLGLLAAPGASGWLKTMDAAGLLTALLPELEASRRCALEYYGRGGVLRHSLDVVARMDFLLDNLHKVFPDLAAELPASIVSWGGEGGSRALLRLAALLHDVAKPATARKVAGRLRFFGHEARGAKTAAAILGRLRFSRAETEGVAACVRHHLRPGNLAANKLISNKAVFRFFRDLGPHGPPLLLVCWADHASYLTEKKLAGVLRFAGEDPHTFKASRVRDAATRKTLAHLQVVHFLLERFLKARAEVLPVRLVDGHEVMKALSLPPGPVIGKLLRKLEEAQAAGKVRTREEALAFLKKQPLRSLGKAINR